MDYIKQILSLIAPIISRWNLSTEAGMKLYAMAVSCLGQDVAPRENEFGCAEAVNNIVFKAFGDYAGGDLSTYRMYHSIQNNKKFVAVKKSQPGDIILSPTGHGNGKLSNGHVGIVGWDNAIMSNDSSTGLFKYNFTLLSWTERYGRLGGFPVLFYRRIVN